MEPSNLVKVSLKAYLITFKVQTCLRKSLSFKFNMFTTRETFMHMYIHIMTKPKKPFLSEKKKKNHCKRKYLCTYIVMKGKTTAETKN